MAFLIGCDFGPMWHAHVDDRDRSNACEKFASYERLSYVLENLIELRIKPTRCTLTLFIFELISFVYVGKIASTTFPLLHPAQRRSTGATDPRKIEEKPGKLGNDRETQKIDTICGIFEWFILVLRCAWVGGHAHLDDFRKVIAEHIEPYMTVGLCTVILPGTLI